MEIAMKTSTGESLVNVSVSERLRLLNEEITPDTAKLFLIAHKLPVTVEFSRRDTKIRWGTAWAKKRKIILYRHCIWMFLHELAHVMAGPGEHHGELFALALQGLYLKWKELEG